MADQPAGFSSPMGSFGGKRASAAAASALHDLMSSAKSYADHMERGAKAAERAAHAQGKAGGSGHLIGSMVGQGSAAGGGTANGGGARIPSGFPPLEHPGDAARGSTVIPFSGGGGQQNGGGAHIPASPGAGGTPGSGPRSFEETEAASKAIYQSQKRNGGGARITAGVGASLWGGVTKAGAAIGAGMVANVDNMRSSDFLANRAALTTASYNKDASAHQLLKDFGGAFRNNEERYAAAMPILQRGGFSQGSAGYNTLTGSARMAAALNPMLASQSGNIATGFQSPELHNRARLFGINTIGAGGQPIGYDKIARQVYQRSVMANGGDPSKMPTTANVQAAFGATGGMRYTLSKTMGMDDNQIQAMQDYMLSSAGAGKWQTGKEAESYGNKSRNTMLGADQRRASSEQELITSQLKEFSNAYIKSQQALSAAISGLAHTIDALPQAIQTALFSAPGAAAAVSKGGGGISNTVGSALTSAAGTALGMIGGRALMRRFGGPAARLGSRLGGPLSRVGGRLGGRLVPGVGWGLAALDAASGLKFAASDDSDDYRARYEAIHAGDHTPGFLRGANSRLAAFEHKALGWIPGVNKALEHGDGPGGRHAAAGWSGIQAGSFRGQQWDETGDGPGSASAQSAKAKERGGQTYEMLEELMKGFKGGYRIVSRVRKGQSGVTATGNTSYHATGHALDIAGPTPVAKGQKGSPALLAINKYLAQFGGGLNELIYSGPGGTNLHNGSPHTYRNPTHDMHYDHVHVAATPAMLKKLKGKGGGGLFGWIKGAAKGAMNFVKSVTGIGKGSPSTGHGTGGSQARDSRLTRLGRGGSVMGQASLIQAIMDGTGPMMGGANRPHTADLAEGNVERNGAGGATGAANPGSHASDIDKFLLGLRMHESRGDYDAEAPGSTASGAYQYLDGTWHGYKGYKHASDAPPNVQDERARADQMRNYEKYKNWRSVAAAHFRGDDWPMMHPDGSPDWSVPVKGNGKTTVNSYVKDVLQRGGLPETGDGPGVSMASTVQADVPTPRSHGRSGGGNMTVHSRGGSSITIGKVEVHLTTPQVSPQEAKRIGKMVVDQIASQARMKEMSR